MSIRLEGSRHGMSIIPRPESIKCDGSDVTVLIVEDSWNVAQSLKCIVENAGALPLGPVPSVREALHVVETRQVSVVLVDMNLRDGFADPLVDELISRSIPYIILTAYEALPTNADREAVARLNKPLDHDLIATYICRFTGRRSNEATV
jgi:DNA-binding NtrC family response regulator